MYLKVLERDGGFQVIEARTVLFRRHPEPVAVCDSDTPTARTFPLTATAYLLNEHGKTIETFMLKPNGDRKS